MHTDQSETDTKPSLKTLALGAVGVVYGDIGTSPLYTIREVFSGANGIALSPDNIFAILSLIFWSLIFVVSFKYLVIVLRADNHGEGGIIALLELALGAQRRLGGAVGWMIAFGVFGASLFFADGVITPAISVLSAVEGVELLTPRLSHYVIPITIGVLFCLFWAQKRGTGSIGVLFGPIMTVWFLSLAVLGLRSILSEPHILLAINPAYAIALVCENPAAAFFSLGGVVLALTGAEALYADMGHFGRKPIQVAWFWLVFPGLLLNYFGQGALLLRDQTGISDPFYLLAPSWGLLPLILLATAATVIASQAVISGAFSLAKQAMQLGYLPRLRVLYTSEQQVGQVYLPFVNWALFATICVLVASFKSSQNLGAAYGLAVTGTMVTTSVLIFFVAKNVWQWKWYVRYPVTLFLLCVDLIYFAANAIKIEEGGWVPLLIGASTFTLMMTWRHGRTRHLNRATTDEMDLDALARDIDARQPQRADGVAVYLKASSLGIPRALLHSYYHSGVLHRTVVVVTVKIAEVPHVADADLVQVERMQAGFYRVVTNYGFKDNPDIPKALGLVKAQSGIDFEPMKTTYYLGRDTLIQVKNEGLAALFDKIFIWMYKNASSATEYFRIPPSRVIEMGTQRVV